MEFSGTFWALVPPIVAIVLALITKEAYSSLFIGVVLGALFVAGFRPVATMDTIINEGLIPAVTGNAGIFIFLVILGIIVALINLSGGSAAFGRWAEKHIKTKIGALLATFALGVLIFVDDYFNCLTVGSVMRPITDSKKISRAKFAYIIDATAAPVCMIAPISSWAAAVAGVAASSGSGMNGIQLFCKAIPYNFYSLLTFVFIIAIILMRFDYGPMAKFEKKADNGELGGLAEKAEEKSNPNGKVIDIIIPVVVLIITCVLAMVYVGGFWSDDPELAGSFVNSFANTDATVALPWGALIGLVFAVIYMTLIRRVIKFKDAMECIPKGFIAMVPAMLILTLAVSLKNMTGLLGADVFVAGLMEGAAAGLYKMLPAVIFVVACFLAFATGTSWGTFGILIPIVTAIFPADSTLFIIGISACCAGAVCGDHCSPISDTTIMSSAGAQVEHVNHVSTQLPYAVTVAAISFATYILAGFVQNAAICIVVGAIATVGVLLIIKCIMKNTQADTVSK